MTDSTPDIAACPDKECIFDGTFLSTNKHWSRQAQSKVRYYRVICGCGYKSPRRPTELLAIKAHNRIAGRVIFLENRLKEEAESFKRQYNELCRVVSQRDRLREAMPSAVNLREIADNFNIARDIVDMNRDDNSAPSPRYGVVGLRAMADKIEALKESEASNERD